MISWRKDIIQMFMLYQIHIQAFHNLKFKVQRAKFKVWDIQYLTYGDFEENPPNNLHLLFMRKFLDDYAICLNFDF